MLASVSGPIEVRPLSELPSAAALEVFVRPLAGLPGPSSKAFASALRSLLLPSLQLARYPRSLVQLVLQAASPSAAGAMRGCGGGGGPAGGAFHPALVAASINAASGALLAAGSVAMTAVVCAASVGRCTDPGVKGGITLVLDPSEDEESGATEGGGCFAFMFGASPGSAMSTASEGPACRLVWTSYAASVSPTTRTFKPVGAEELAQATAIAENSARAVWVALKGSISSLDGPRSGFILGRSTALDTPLRKKAAPGPNPVDTGGVELGDEMEEVDELDDARMEI